MAETVGVFASAITVAQVAASVGSAVMKLKILWDEIQDVPETINDLMRQIEIIEPFLRNLEIELKERQSAIQPTLFDDIVMQRSIDYCREATNTLQNIVQDLSTRINAERLLRRSFGKVRVVLNKRVINRSQSRLQTAVSMVNLAQQSYIMTLIKLQPHIIVGQLKEAQEVSRQQLLTSYNNTGIKEPCSASRDFVTSINEGPRPMKRRGRIVPWTMHSLIGSIVASSECEEAPNGLSQTWCQIRLQLPLWLGNRLWDIWSTKALSGWTIRLRVWHIVPSNSPTMIAARRGHTAELAEMFRNGRGSPFDRNMYGATLMHMAASAQQFETVKMLAAAGLNCDEVNFANLSPISLFLMPYVPGGVYTAQRLPDERSLLLHNFFVNQGFMDGLEEDERSVEVLPIYAERLLRAGHDAALEYTKMHLLPFFHRLSFPMRLHNIFDWPQLSPVVLRFCLWPKRIRREHSATLTWLGISFSHVLARCLGARPWPITTPEYEEWRSVFQETKVVADMPGLSLCAAQDELDWPSVAITPFIAFLYTADFYTFQNLRQNSLRDTPSREHGKHLLYALHGWLSLLKSCGVDLEEYGQVEQRELVITPFRERWAPYHANSRREYSMALARGPKLKSFLYGPNVDDWSLEWDMEVEEFAGDFWDMVEEVRILVPGAWPD